MSHPLAAHAGVRRLVTAAAAAPSVHNTQPWRFRRRGDEVMELHVDIDRLLHVIDQRGRAMHISCGAALFNLRLAARVAGYQPLVWSLPDLLDEPTLLASVRIAAGRPPTLAEAALYAAIRERRTSRVPFSARPVSREIMDRLVAAADREGATLHLPSPRASARVLGLVAAADHDLAADPAYRAELANWTLGEGRSDGVPWYAFGPRPSGRGLPLRDFGLIRALYGRLAEDFGAPPRIALLTTEGDRPEDWLHAGQALQRVLLTATCHGVSASFMTQPLDVQDMCRNEGIPQPLDRIQMIIRFGYGPAVPGTPRRPYREVLDRAA